MKKTNQVFKWFVKFNADEDKRTRSRASCKLCAISARAVFDVGA